MIIECRCGPGNGPLAELTRHAALQHPPRTPERRAAGHLRAALITTTSAQSAKRALATFGSSEVQADAARLLHELSVELCTMCQRAGAIAETSAHEECQLDMSRHEKRPIARPRSAERDA